MVWCGSTEAYQEPTAVHDTVEAFEAGLRADDENISPSQIYVYAALVSRCARSPTVPRTCRSTCPAWSELADRRGVPVTGKDFKTGQTLMKTILAPGFKARMLGMRGWYSTNILGNRDGEVLDDPENFKTKEVSKLGVLDTILQPEVYPELYGNIDHVVRINYYPPRGDNKEGWDAIDIFGWMGYPMQIKVDFLCRDSILAAPIVLDLALFLDLAQRAGPVRRAGVAELLLEGAPGGRRRAAGARHLHPADQAEEHPAGVDGRGAGHPLRGRAEALPPGRDGRLGQTPTEPYDQRPRRPARPGLPPGRPTSRRTRGCGPTSRCTATSATACGRSPATRDVQDVERRSDVFVSGARLPLVVVAGGEQHDRPGRPRAPGRSAA